MSPRSAHPSRVRTAPLFFATGLILTLASAASADPPREHRERVVVTSKRAAVLEERLAEESAWRVVCRAPCEARVVAAPMAEHRVIVKGEREPTPVYVPAGQGDVAIDIPEDERNLALAVSGVTLAVIGNGVMLAALAALTRDRSPVELDARVPTMAGVGLAAGAFGVVLTVLALRSPAPPRVTAQRSPPRPEPATVALPSTPGSTRLVVPILSLAF